MAQIWSLEMIWFWFSSNKLRSLVSVAERLVERWLSRYSQTSWLQERTGSSPETESISSIWALSLGFFSGSREDSSRRAMAQILIRAGMPPLNFVI